MSEKGKVIIATSDEGLIPIFKKLFDARGIEAVVFRNGPASLEHIITQGVPDLVIVDIDLPLIDGAKLFQILQNNPRTKDIPFFFIGKDANNIRGFRKGIDEYFIMPLDSDSLLEEIAGFPRAPGSQSGPRTPFERDPPVFPVTLFPARQIRSYRLWVRERFESQLAQNLEALKSKGMFPYEGRWRPLGEIAGLQKLMRRKDRTIFFDLLFLLILLIVVAAFLVSFLFSL